MIKNIKRVGIIFLAVAIICLTFCAVTLVENTATNDNATIVNNGSRYNVNGRYELSGDCNAMAVGWSEAIQDSMDNNRTVRITLKNNWIAQQDSTYFTSFGDGVGFNYGRIFIPPLTSVVLDLNGFNIDRNLTAPLEFEYGHVIVIDDRCVFELRDSSYDTTLAHQTLESNPENLTKLPFGKVKGGVSSYLLEGRPSNGAGIRIQGNSVFNMYGGIICDNTAQSVRSRGGGIATTDSQESAVINIYAGIVASNTSECIAGGIYMGNGTVNLYDAIIYGNTAKVSGGGIFMLGEKARLNLYNTASIVDNKCLQSNGSFSGIELSDTTGGIAMYDRTQLLLKGNVIFDKNSSPADTSDILLLQNQKINIQCELSNKICVKLSSDYGLFNSFTNGYSSYNSASPDTIFVSVNSKQLAKLKSGEVMFDCYPQSNYDFVYLSNGYRKYYKDNELLHNYNDEVIDKFVLGKIEPNTSVNEFMNNIIPFGFENLELYDSKGNMIYKNNSAVTNEDYNNGNEFAVGTGWYLEHTLAGNKERIYLSVLGDLTGDGKVNSADVNCLRKIVSDSNYFETLAEKPYLQLAMMITNCGSINSSCSDVLWNVVCNKDKIINYL